MQLGCCGIYRRADQRCYDLPPLAILTAHVQKFSRTSLGGARSSFHAAVLTVPPCCVLRPLTSSRPLTDSRRQTQGLRATQDRWLAQQELDVSERVPVRGTNRLEALTIAVAPLQKTMDAEALERLTQALMFMCGVEALVVARDALHLDEEAAADVMS